MGSEKGGEEEEGVGEVKREDEMQKAGESASYLKKKNRKIQKKEEETDAHL